MRLRSLPRKAGSPLRNPTGPSDPEKSGCAVASRYYVMYSIFTVHTIWVPLCVTPDVKATIL